MPTIHENKGLTVIESDVTPVANVITLNGIAAHKRHCFVGAQFFADAQGQTQATPGAGSIAMAFQAVNTEPVFETVPSSPILGATPVTLAWEANTKTVRATPTGITVATHYRIVVTCNQQ